MQVMPLRLLHKSQLIKTFQQESAMYIPVHMVYYSYTYVCRIKNRFESGTMPIHMHSHAGC